MPIEVSTRNYIGRGPVAIGLRSGGIVRNFGEAPEVTLQISVNKVDLPDTSASGGGNADSLERVESVTGSITLAQYSAENLAIGLRGTITDIAAGAVNDEAHDGYLGGWVPFDYLYDPDTAPTLTRNVSAAWPGATTAVAKGAAILDTGRIYIATAGGTTGGSEPTWPTNGTTVTDGTVTWLDTGTPALVADTDYTLNAMGAVIADDSTKLLAGYAMPLLVDYTKNAASRVQALTSAALEYRMFFAGLNEGGGDAYAPARFHRVKFSPTDGLSFKSDEWATMTLNFELLADATITGAGLSKFMAWDMPA